MKMLKKLIMPFVLYANIIYSAEKVGIISDEFYANPTTIVTIRELIPHDKGYMAIVDGSSSYHTETTSIVPFFKEIWEHKDDRKISVCKILATVICGPKKVEFTFPLKEEHPYSLLREIEDKTSELTVGTTVTFYKIKEFERPDKSIFREIGSPLYLLIMNEERVSAPEVAVCFKEWVITSKWQRKTRHARRFYSAIDVYHTTLKRMCNVTGSNDEIVSKVLIRKELTFRRVDSESDQCGNNGGNLPNGAIIIA